MRQRAVILGSSSLMAPFQSCNMTLNTSATVLLFLLLNRDQLNLKNQGRIGSDIADLPHARHRRDSEEQRAAISLPPP